ISAMRAAAAAEGRSIVVGLLSALARAVALEGVLYAAFPGPMRRALMSLAEISGQSLRVGGLSALALGVLVVWFVRGGDAAPHFVHNPTHNKAGCATMQRMPE